MIKSEEQILADIDATLDQLICNAEIVKIAPIEMISELEIAALQKTQESLLARLLHMHEHVSQSTRENEKLHQKVSQFGQLNQQLISGIRKKFQSKPNLLRSKSFKKII